MTALAGLFLSYFLGSLPTGFLVGKIVKGVDIRKEGSGNVGATNVFRVVGKRWGMAVLLVDILKGYLAVSLIPPYFLTHALPIDLLRLTYGLAAITGHTWTLWLRFRGGKGVATSLGAFLGLTPEATGAALVVWILLFLWRRYVSLASLGMAVSFPFWVFGFYRSSDFFRILFPVSLGLVIFIFYTHRENIQRLRKGEEKQII